MGDGNLMKNPTLYNMIVQSEDRSRTAVETVVYALLITSVVVSIVAAAVQAVTLPGRVSVNQTNTEYRA